MFSVFSPRVCVCVCVCVCSHSVCGLSGGEGLFPKECNQFPTKWPDYTKIRINAENQILNFFSSSLRKHLIIKSKTTQFLTTQHFWSRLSKAQQPCTAPGSFYYVESYRDQAPVSKRQDSSGPQSILTVRLFMTKMDKQQYQHFLT
jgi:hypothetical protein